MGTVTRGTIWSAWAKNRNESTLEFLVLLQGLPLSFFHCLEDFGKNHKPDQYVKFLNQARVQFVQSGTSHLAPDGYLAQRFFECLAIGPMLTNYHPDLEFLGLVENVDYMVFRNEDDMVAKMNFLLKDEEFRNQMRINGRKKALLLHSYDHRLITILNIIREHDASRPPD